MSRVHRGDYADLATERIVPAFTCFISPPHMSFAPVELLPHPKLLSRSLNAPEPIAIFRAGSPPSLKPALLCPMFGVFLTPRPFNQD